MLALKTKPFPRPDRPGEDREILSRRFRKKAGGVGQGRAFEFARRLNYRSFV